MIMAYHNNIETTTCSGQERRLYPGECGINADLTALRYLAVALSRMGKPCQVDVRRARGVGPNVNHQINNER